MEIANTILQQIRTLTPTPVLWSWGASKYQAVKENQIDGIGEDYLGALMFFVRGYKHKGHVIVSLAPSDTYTVSIGHIRKGKMNVKKQIKDIFFDELGSTIDELVEKRPEYKY